MLSTRTKIRLAGIASTVVRTARSIAGKSSNSVRVMREGVHWELDLREGIDFAIYLGIFERSTVNAYRKLTKPGSVVLDIGANIGAHTLILADHVGPGGRIYAFEPTDFAFSKLVRNLSLNPQLSGRVVTTQAFLGESADVMPDEDIYSSWPLTAGTAVHEKHLGRAESVSAAVPIVLDRFVQDHLIEKIDVIKMDVDGFECHVLSGAGMILRKFKPAIVMELAPYVLQERGRSLGELVALLTQNGYAFHDLDGTILPQDADELNNLVPAGASMNVLALARNA